jgi:Glyoxalase/Bleomycin resistance protein/Dioxygenase superfamily
MSLGAPDGLVWNPDIRRTEMAETESPTRISQVGTVFVPVTDQDRALEFYLGKLGFEKRGDFRYGEGAREGRARHLLFDADRDMANATVPAMFFFRDGDGNRFLVVDAG